MVEGEDVGDYRRVYMALVLEGFIDPIKVPYGRAFEILIERHYKAIRGSLDKAYLYFFNMVPAMAIALLAKHELFRSSREKIVDFKLVERIIEPMKGLALKYRKIKLPYYSI